MLETGSPGEVDLRRYLRALRTRKKVIGAVVLATVATALVLSAMQTRLYQAQAQLLLQSRTSESPFASTAPATQVDPKLLIDTEEKVVESAPIRAVVTRRIGPVRKVQATRLDETLIIEVKSQSTDRRRAAAVANAYADAYIEHRRQAQTDDLDAVARQLAATVADLQGQIDRLDAGVDQTPPAQRDAARAAASARRDSLVAQQGTFRQRLEEVQVEATLQAGGAELVAAATAPRSPVQPTPVRNAILALAIGLLFGVSAAVLLEYFDDSVRTVDDLVWAAGDLPVLGIIPSVESWRRRSAPVTTTADSDPSVAEAYRSLRTAVQLLGVERPVVSLQVTSPIAAEGKTTTLCNLAIAMARAGQRVAVVDCDLRRPRVHDAFGVSGEVGLTSVLAGDADVAGALQVVPGWPAISVLPAGPHAPNPSELLGARPTSEILFGLQSEFDVVLVDSPPALPVTDAIVASTWVEATIVVVAADATTTKQLRAALALLRQAEARIAGAVLNRAQVEASYGYGYGYGYDRRARHRGTPPADRPQDAHRPPPPAREPAAGEPAAATFEPPVGGAA